VEPLHEVVLKPFFLSKYEMTQGQWLRFTRENPSVFGTRLETIGKSHSYLQPVEYVSWDDSTSVLFKLGLRLPSEAEWEYAARAGTGTVWWTGDEKETLAGSANILDTAVITEKLFKVGTTGYEDWLDDKHSTPAPVGTYRANAFGLHDVCGNVFEWCRDSYEGYEITPRDGSAYESAEVPGRVIRGGAWNSIAINCRSCFRIWCPPDHENNYIGVRPACTLRD
jgi:formylglycine-generating enzyme required for sulfatase activity